MARSRPPMPAFAQLIIALAALGVSCHTFWERLVKVEEKPDHRRFLRWFAKGVLVPYFAWLGINGAFPGVFPSLFPAGNLAHLRPGSWLGNFLNLTSAGAAVIGSYWAAATLIWLWTKLYRLSSDRREVLVATGFWMALLSPVFYVILRLLGWPALGLVVWLGLLPGVYFGLPSAIPTPHIPSYGQAIGRMKMGKYEEAEQAVLEQLEGCETDFDGWMMLAELYANHFRELSEADRTIRELCRQPGTCGVHISLALHRLADWHLRLGKDPDAARAALATIAELLPGSHFARMALQRLAQIPAGREELEEQSRIKTIRLPALSENLPDHSAQASLPDSRAQAAAAANRCVDQLKHNPNDILARERFALLLAERLGKPKLACEQLDLLLGMTEPSPKKRAEWLSYQAAWSLNLLQDVPASRMLLERILREYPKTAYALAARRRLHLLDEQQALRDR